MAPSYGLSLARQVDPAEAIEVVRDLVGGRPTEDGRLVVMDGLIATATPVTHPTSRDVAHEEWGFDAELRLDFALGPEPEDRERAEDTMSVAAAGVAAHLDSDAGFSLQGERKLFLRRDGMLTLYFGWRPWNEPAVLARVPAPYTIEG
jgi:hypothetical protein